MTIFATLSFAALVAVHILRERPMLKLDELIIINE